MPTQNTPKVERISIFPIKSCHSIEVVECDVDSLGIQYDRRFMIVEAETNKFITQRKNPSLTFLLPHIDPAANTLTLTAKNQQSLSVPLIPDYTTLSKRTVKVWKDTVTVYDMGEEASVWVTQFLLNHVEHDIRETKSNEKGLNVAKSSHKARLVTLQDPKEGVYKRPSHPKLPGIHTPLTDDSPITFGFTSSLADVNKNLLKTNFSKNNQVSMDKFRNNITISGTNTWEEDEWLVVRIGDVTFYVVHPISRCPVTGIDQETGIRDNWDGKYVADYLKITRRFKDNPNEGHFCSHTIPLTAGKIYVGDTIEILERIPEEYAQHPLPSTI